MNRSGQPFIAGLPSRTLCRPLHLRASSKGHGKGNHRDRADCDPVEDLGSCDEQAGHSDHDRRSRDKHGAPGRTRGRLERVVRARTAATLLARADDVEERIVDADRHAD